MSELNNTVAKLLEEKTIDLFIGYGQGTGNRVRAIFVRTTQQAANLITNQKCTQNLAGYVLKHEVRKSGRLGLLANDAALRSVMQLAAEFQLKDGELYILHAAADGTLNTFPDFSAIETYLDRAATDITADEKEQISRIQAMTVSERWNFWQNEFDRCIKCYACRAACPMCYCHRCTTDANQPQWIPVPSHPLGNLDYHLMRAMHLAGRCVNCGECAKACPMDIPLNLLTYQFIRPLKEDFNAMAGMKANAVYALSTFKPDDKENFII